MKENLILKKYQTQPVNGTFSMKEVKTFFGSKMMDIEDNIMIDSKTLQYSDTSEGFQYFEDEKKEANEIFKTPNLNGLKENNHNIRSFRFGSGIWNFNINTREILINYLFYKIKEKRTFKSIRTNNLQDQNIDDAIRQYIEYNVIDRYKFSKIDLFVKIQNITQSQNVKGQLQLKSNPQYDPTIESQEYLIDDFNLQANKNDISQIYLTYALKNPRENNFNYYFNIHFEKR